MCLEAKIEGNFTNHCLRATGATRLFNAGVSETLTTVYQWTMNL